MAFLFFITLFIERVLVQSFLLQQLVASSETTIKCKLKNRDPCIFGVYFTNLFVMAREENTINKEAESGNCVLLSEYLFWQ